MHRADYDSFSKPVLLGYSPVFVWTSPNLSTALEKLDPTRPTTAADDQSQYNHIDYITDIIAFNRYPGWYGGKMTDFPTILDGILFILQTDDLIAAPINTRS